MSGSLLLHALFARDGGRDCDVVFDVELDGSSSWPAKPRIAVFSGPQSTVGNTAPLLTKCFTSGVLNVFGDVFAQFMFEDAARNGCDWRRAGVFALLGFALVGPCLHFWYSSLSKIVAATGAVGNASAGVSLALDQLVFAPTFLAVFIASLFTVEGNASAVPAKLRQDWASTVVTNWKIWVPFQFLNFRFVPVNLQVLAANVIALAWNTYMSWVSHKPVEETVARK